MRALPAIVFVALSLIAAELTYRVYALGPGALRPAVLNSNTTIIESGLIKAADEPQVYFDLQPNLDTLFSGVPLRTNSYGMADQEYSVAKPAGTYRIAVLGSSWSMASGVPPEDSWHAQLETQLAATASSPRVEFLNFAVEQYGLGEMIGTLRYKLPAWQPDLIIASITSLTAYIPRENYTQSLQPPPARKPFYESFVLRQLGGMLDLNLYPQAMRGSFGPRMTEYREQTVASIAEMKALADEQGAQLVIVWLGFRPLLDKQKVAVEAVTAELGIPLYLGYEPLTPNSDVEWGGKFHDPKYQVSRFNKHPNRLGHRLIADVVYEGLTRDGLLQTR